MQICADKIIHWMIRCNVIEETDQELYLYAMQSAVIQIVPLVLACMIGGFLGNTLFGMATIFPFMILRKFSGGFHSKNLWICLTGSGLLLVLCITSSQSICFSYSIILLTLAASISLICFSPVENNNRILNLNDQKYFKRRIAFWECLFWIFMMILHQIGMDQYNTAVSVGIDLTAALQLPCVLKKHQKQIENVVSRKMG